MSTGDLQRMVQDLAQRNANLRTALEQICALPLFSVSESVRSKAEKTLRETAEVPGGVAVPRSITDWCVEAHRLARENGWYNDETAVTRDMLLKEKLLLVHAEISEAAEELRTRAPDVVEVVDGKPEGFTIELADAVIRIFDLCAYMSLDLERAIKTKHAYNKTRSYRHGGKKF